MSKFLADKDFQRKSVNVSDESKDEETCKESANCEVRKSCKNEVPDPQYVRVILLTDVKGRERSYRVPAALDLDRPKRPRTTFSPAQIERLEQEFMQNHFLSVGRRRVLASLLNLSETQVKVWFQNRRTKARRRNVQGRSPVSLQSFHAPPHPQSISTHFQISNIFSKMTS